MFVTSFTFPNTNKTVLINARALSTWNKKWAAVQKLKDLGGIHAGDTPETRKLMNDIIFCNRKIEKNNWKALS